MLQTGPAADSAMPLRIAAVADLVPGTVFRPLPDSPFFRHVHDADVAIANLEVPLTARLNPLHSGIVLHAAAEFAHEARRAGFDVVSLANNHIGGHGRPGIEDTLAACAAAGIQTLGFGEDREDASKPLIIDVAGTRVAFVSATSVGPRDTFAGPGAGVSGLRVTTSRQEDPRAADNPGVIGRAVTEPVEEDLALLEHQVRQARQEASLVVAFLHWGNGEVVHDYMRTAARRLIDAGAGAVFGHHTHRLAAVDWYRSAPVFYGLGNFLFQYDGETPVHVPRDAAIALVEFEPERGLVAGARLIIGKLGDDGVPYPAHPEWVKRVVEELQRLSAGNNVVIDVLEDGCAIRGRGETSADA